MRLSRRRRPARSAAGRLIALLMLVPAAAQAWTFSPVPVCTLTHDSGSASLTVTYDPTQPEPYALDLVRKVPLPPGPVFALDFGSFAISTDRHRLLDDGTRLRVTDRGFGNVLSGLSAGTGARALVGDEVVEFPTGDAAAAVEAFRQCPEAQLS